MGLILGASSPPPPPPPPAPSGDGLLLNIPTYADEQAAYAEFGWSTSGAQLDILDGGYSAGNLSNFTDLNVITDIHGDTECDDLYIAYINYKRLLATRPTAAASWLTRATNLADFFTNNYIDSATWDDENDNWTHDHIYGWGLFEWGDGESDSAAIATGNELITRMAAFNSGPTGGDIGWSQSFGRRWGRQLRLACAAQRYSPSTANRTWRDKALDFVLETPNWNSTFGFYFVSDSGAHDGEMGAGSFASGDRFMVSWQCAMLIEALWIAWVQMDAESDSRRFLTLQRVVDQATFLRDMPLDGTGHLGRNLGYNINTSASINTGGTGQPAGVYSLASIGPLVFGYKATGDSTYLDRARTLFMNYHDDLTGGSDTVHHFADSEIASGTEYFFLGNNKTEVGYIYPLFENGGVPIVVEGYVPAWAENMATDTWFALSGANGFSGNREAIDVAPSDPGGTASGNWNPTNCFQDWCGGLYDTRRNRLVIMNPGGHNNHPGNEIYAFGNLLSENPEWTLLETASVYRNDQVTYADGTPASTHSYGLQMYHADMDRYFHVGQGSITGQGFATANVIAYNPATGDYDRTGGSAAGVYPDKSSVDASQLIASAACYDARNNAAWWITSRTGNETVRITANMQTVTTYGTPVNDMGIHWNLAHNSDVGYMLTLGDGERSNTMYFMDTDNPAGGWTELTNVTDSSSAFSDGNMWVGTNQARNYLGWQYHPPSGDFVAIDAAANLWRLTPPATLDKGDADANEWTWTRVTISGTAPTGFTRAGDGDVGWFGRFQWVPMPGLPEQGLFIIAGRTDEPVNAVKIAV